MPGVLSTHKIAGARRSSSRSSAGRRLFRARGSLVAEKEPGNRLRSQRENVNKGQAPVWSVKKERNGLAGCAHGAHPRPKRRSIGCLGKKGPRSAHGQRGRPLFRVLSLVPAVIVGKAWVGLATSPALGPQHCFQLPAIWG